MVDRKTFAAENSFERLGGGRNGIVYGPGGTCARYHRQAITLERIGGGGRQHAGPDGIGLCVIGQPRDGTARARGSKTARNCRPCLHQYGEGLISCPQLRAMAWLF